MAREANQTRHMAAVGVSAVHAAVAAVQAFVSLSRRCERAYVDEIEETQKLASGLHLPPRSTVPVVMAHMHWNFVFPTVLAKAPPIISPIVIPRPTSDPTQPAHIALPCAYTVDVICGQTMAWE
jgi:hypothetical protein